MAASDQLDGFLAGQVLHGNLHHDHGRELLFQYRRPVGLAVLGGVAEGQLLQGGADLRRDLQHPGLPKEDDAAELGGVLL